MNYPDEEAAVRRLEAQHASMFRFGVDGPARADDRVRSRVTGGVPLVVLRPAESALQGERSRHPLKALADSGQLPDDDYVGQNAYWNSSRGFELGLLQRLALTPSPNSE
jgi:hypothetical protein